MTHCKITLNVKLCANYVGYWNQSIFVAAQSLIQYTTMLESPENLTLFTSVIKT